MRFKPPPPNSSIGWRIEFRVLDAQLTDFENAAFAVFIVLLTRVILTYKLDFIIPISCVSSVSVAVVAVVGVFAVAVVAGLRS